MSDYIMANPFVFVVGCLQLAGGMYSWKVNGDAAFGILWSIYALSCWQLVYIEYLRGKG